MQSVSPFRHFFPRRAGFVFGVIFLAAFFSFVGVETAHAVSTSAFVSPSGTKYPGDSYGVGVSIYNDRSAPISVRNDWFYSRGGGWIYWTSSTATVGPNSTGSLSQSSTAEPAGTVMSFAVNSYWGSCGSDCAQSTTGFTVQARPVSYSISAGSNTSYCTGCGSSVSAGSPITITAATPPPGYRFSSWSWTGSSNPCSGAGSGSCSFSASQSGTAAVNFAPITYYYSISASAGTGGAVSCPSCGSSVQSGAEVKATAAANPGYKFVSWSGLGSGCSSASSSCTITAGSSGTITANFAVKTYTLSTSVSSGSDSGSVSGSGFYNSGSSATVQAIPSESDGYEFSSWGGACAGKPNPCTLTMDSDKSVSASFSRLAPSAPRITRATSQCTLSGKLSYHTANTIAWNAADYPSGTTFKIYIAPGETGSVSDFLTSVTFSSFTQRLRTLQYTPNVQPPFPNSSYNGSIDDLSYKVSAVVNGIESGKSNYAYLSGTEDANQCAARLESEPPLPPKQPVREIIYPKAETGPCETPGTIKLSWTKADATKWSGYRIYRFDKDPLVDNTSYQTVTVSMSDPKLKSVANNQVEYIDTAPKQNTRYWYVIEALTRADLGAQSGARNLGAVLLAQAGAGIQSAHTGRIPGPSGDDPGTVSSGACPLPNLTANAPTIAGTPTGIAGELYAGEMTISGVVRNPSTVSVSTTFNNGFQFSAVDPATRPTTDKTIWTNWVSQSLPNLSAGNSAPVSYSWTGDPGTYWFRLVADSAGLVDESNELDNASPPTKVVIKPAPLASPTLLTNTPSCTEGAGKIKVWWASVPNATSYKLYRSASVALNGTHRFANIAYAQTGVEIGTFTTPPTQANPFEDKNLDPGKKYDYQVKAFGADGISSPASATRQDDASKRCPDLIVERITLPTSAGLPTGTVLSATAHTFSAVIKNVGEGTDATKTFFNRVWVNDGVIRNDANIDQRITGGLGAGLTKPITSGSWIAPTVTANTTRTLKVCADQPPLPPDRGNVVEANPDGTPAELNNCKDISLTIVPPLKATVECKDPKTGEWRKDYCIIDYGTQPELRWSTEGSPSDCVARGDWEGKRDPKGGIVRFLLSKLGKSGNPFVYSFSAECTR